MLIDSLATTLHLDGATSRTYSILALNGKGVHIEGTIRIKNCTSVRIDLAVGKTALSFFGENLKIRDLTLGSVTILGRIIGCVNTDKWKNL